MEVIGERINTSRKHINKAVSERNTEYIQEQVRMQDKAGADYIDVNAGTSVSAEVGDLEWLMDIVQEVTDKPLCIDSANPKAIESALKRSKNGTPIVNSITGEKNRIDNILPLVKEYNTKVVALTMDDSGMPENLEKRVDVAKKLADRLTSEGISLDRVYFDTLIRPISTNPDQVGYVLQAVSIIMKELKGVHTICGLSNVSFGLPKRNHINRSFLSLMIHAGLDAAIIDPTEADMVSTIYATQALIGKDNFCMEYITADREGKY